MWPGIEASDFKMREEVQEEIPRGLVHEHEQQSVHRRHVQGLVEGRKFRPRLVGLVLQAGRSRSATESEIHAASDAPHRFIRVCRHSG